MKLYAIIDHDCALAHGYTVAQMALQCLDAGARLLQIRAKQMPAGELLQVCEEVAEQARRVGATLIVNDRVDIARLVAGAGVHVGQDDLPAAAARQLLGDQRVVGLSTHSTAQADEALLQPISYLAVGPVFGTRTKETGYSPVGLDLVRYAADRAGSIPVVAIGGITLDTAAAVIDAGASSVAVISDLFTGGDLASRIRAYVKI